jgi:hypothetical protein
MSYSFDIIGISPVLNFFNYQQKIEQHPSPSKTYVGSYRCTLDAFIQSTELTPRKPDWDWDDVVGSIVQFWLSHEEAVQHWQDTLADAEDDSLIVARIANFESLRTELESLLDG